MSSNNRTKDTEKGFSWRKMLKNTLVTVLLVVFAGVFGVLIYLNARKNEITENLLQLVNKEITGEFTVEGVSLGNIFSYPHLEVNIKELKFWESKLDSNKTRRLVITVPRVSLQTDLSDVFSKHILINQLILKQARLFIERDSTGLMVISEAFSSVSKSRIEDRPNDSTGLQIDVLDIGMYDSHVFIEDRPSATHIPIHLDRLNGDFSFNRNLIRGKANVVIDPSNLIDTLGIPIDTFKISLRSEYEVDLDRKRVTVESPETDIAQYKYALSISHDYSKTQDFKMELNSLEQGLDLANLNWAKKDSSELEGSFEIAGKADFRSKVSWKPEANTSFYESLDISISMEGKELVIHGIDLDKIIEKFKRSQNFNLADVGAVMFAGPAGLAVTKGGDYASLVFTGSGDSTLVKNFFASWHFDHGQLNANDVAMSTLKNRLAMDGWFNAVSDSLMFGFHVVDKKGCQLVGQRIYGSVAEPTYGRISLLETFLGPVKNFFRDIGISKCKVVYSGRVEHPDRKRKKE